MEINYIIPSITLAFILLDICSGIIQAFANKEVSSEKMRKGLFHKIAFILFIILGYMCEFACVYMELGFNFPIGDSVCVYICLTEIVSIVENIAKLNPDLAGSKLLDLFKQ